MRAGSMPGTLWRVGLQDACRREAIRVRIAVHYLHIVPKPEVTLDAPQLRENTDQRNKEQKTLVAALSDTTFVLCSLFVGSCYR